MISYFSPRWSMLKSDFGDMYCYCKCVGKRKLGWYCSETGEERSTVLQSTLQYPEYTISSIDGIIFGDLQSFLHLFETMAHFLRFLFNLVKRRQNLRAVLCLFVFQPRSKCSLKSKAVGVYPVQFFLKTFRNSYPRAGHFHRCFYFVEK